jgi:hypothetical protein
MELNGVDGADQWQARAGKANPGAGWFNDGTSGENRKHTLFIYSDDIQIDGSLTINLERGRWGRWGRWRPRWWRWPGHTRMPWVAMADKAEVVSRGGNGGDGGSLTIQCKRCPDYTGVVGKQIIQVKIMVGLVVLGGEAGRGGLAGLGSVARWSQRNSWVAMAKKVKWPVKTVAITFNRN